MTQRRTALAVLQVVFRDATDALRWCVAVQMQLLNINWSTTIAEDAAGRCPDDVGTLCVPSSSVTCPLPASVKDLARKCKCPSVRRSPLPPGQPQQQCSCRRA